MDPTEIEDNRDVMINVRSRVLTRSEHESEIKDQANSFDHYATSKSVSQNMLNISTIQGLIVIMVDIFARRTFLNNFQIALIVLICLSISLQFVIFVLLVVLARSRTEQIGTGCCFTTATALNSTVTSLSGLLLMITSGITILATTGATGVSSANISSQVSSIVSKLENTTNSSCVQNGDIEQNISNQNVTIRGATCGDITFSNQAVVNQTCDITNSSAALQELAQSLTNKQKTALSIAANVNISDVNSSTSIKNIINQKCGNATSIKQNVSGQNLIIEPYVTGGILGIGQTVIPAGCGALTFNNSSSLQQQCILNAAITAAQKMEQKLANDQTVTGIIPDIGSLALFALLPCICIVVIIIIMMVAGSAAKNKASSGDGGIAAIQAKQGAATGTAGTAGTAPPGQAAANAAGFLGGLKSAMADRGYKFSTKSGLKKFRGGARRALSSALQGVPIIVLVILAFVVYAKSTEQKEYR